MLSIVRALYNFNLFVLGWRKLPYYIHFRSQLIKTANKNCYKAL